MAETGTNSPIAAPPDAANGNPASPFTRVADAARSAASRGAFLEQALEIVAPVFASPFALVYLHSGAETIERERHSGGDDPRFWKSAVHGCLTDALADCAARAKLLSARDASLRVALLAAPLGECDGSANGAICLVARVDDADRDARHQLALLESLAALIGQCAADIGKRGAAKSSSASNQGLSRAAAFETPEQLAFSVTNNLRNKIGAELVALGVEHNRRIRILSISGLDQVRTQMPAVRDVRAAMEECLDRDAVIAVSPDGGFVDEGQSANYRMHAQWHETSRGASVASIPLHQDGRCIAVLSLRRGGESPFTPEELTRIRDVVEPYVTALRLLRKAQRGLLRHAVDAVGETARWCFRPGSVGAKLLIVGVVCAAIWFCFGAMPYSISVPAQLVPTHVRHVAARHDGLIVETFVTPGARVAQGEVLCRLDTRELELERDARTAERAVAEQQRHQALAENDPVESQLAAANVELLDKQLALLDLRIERATLRSPVDGVVVAGDLRRRVGDTVTQGETLFEVARLDGWTLELESPESVAGDLEAGLTGTFAPNARPEAAEPFEIIYCRPTAEIREQRNVYVAEAAAQLDADGLYPGMRGVAQVNAGDRPVWWVALHRVIDYLYLNGWL